MDESLPAGVIENGRRHAAMRPQTAPGSLDIGDVVRGARTFASTLADLKAELGPESLWYPYGSIRNFEAMDALLKGPHRDVAQLAGGRTIADVGGADGDCAFYLESLGFDVQLLDYPPTNFNGLQGARLLKNALSSAVEIIELDIDDRFELPEADYGLVFFLGLLYHLKNPFYALEAFARRTRYLILSTRVTRFSPGGTVRLADLPVAYLVDEFELNQDPTNFWIFSEAGLRRLLARSGWDVCELRSFGDTDASEPATYPEKDERIFCLLRSRRLGVI